MEKVCKDKCGTMTGVGRIEAAKIKPLKDYCLSCYEVRRENKARLKAEKIRKFVLNPHIKPCGDKCGTVEGANRLYSYGITGLREYCTPCADASRDAMRNRLNTDPQKRQAARNASNRYNASDIGQKTLHAYRRSDKNKEIQKNFKIGYRAKPEVREHELKQGRAYEASKHGKAVRKAHFDSPQGRANRHMQRIRRRERENGAIVPDKPVPLEVFNIEGKSCSCCGTTKKLTRDHIHPLKLGGLDIEENLDILCHRCNASKGISPACKLNHNK